MKHTLTQSQPSLQNAQPDVGGDPFFLCFAPIVDPLFAPSQSPFSKEVAEPLAKLEAFVSNPSVETMELAQEGAATLCVLMGKVGPRQLTGSRETFRRDFAMATLEQIGALDACEGSVQVLKERLIDPGTNGSPRLSDSILAGITDLNDAVGARLRRLYSRDGGLCDRLAERFEAAIDHTQEIRNTYRRKTSRRFDGSEPAALIREVLDPIIAKARAAMKLVPPGRAFVPKFEERVANTLDRLGDYHFADATRSMEGLVGDMRELKHVFLAVEGLEKRLGNRVEASRTRRSGRAAKTLDEA